MKISPFLLEQYFAKHEFTARHLYSSSDCDGFAMQDILSLLDSDEKEVWHNLHLGYTESKGSAYLREAILPFYPGLDIDNILVSSPGELAFTLLNTLLRSGDHVVCIAPCYQSLSEVPISLGCKMSFWMPEPGSWTYSVEDLRALIRPDTRLVMLNFPQNPTGACPTPSQWQEIIEVVKESGAWLYSDEMYHRLWTGDDCLPIAPACTLYDKAFSLWGMSKSFGMAGLRIGWLVGRHTEILQKAMGFKDYLSICNSAPSELLSAFALHHFESFLQPNIAKIRHNISIFKNTFADGKLFGPFVPPRAGSVAFVPLNLNMSAIEFSDSLVEATGIMTVPCEMFSYPGKYLRIGFGRKDFADVSSIIYKSFQKIEKKQ